MHCVRLALVPLLLLCSPVNCPAQEEESAEAIELATGAMLQAIHDENREVRELAWNGLTAIETTSEEVIEAVGAALLDDDAVTRQAAMRVVSSQKWDNATKGQMLFRMLNADNPQIAAEAASNFAAAWQTDFLGELLEELQSDATSPERRGVLLIVIGRNSQQLSVILPALEATWHESPVEFQLQILNTIGRYGEAAKGSLPFLAAQADHPNEKIRLATIGSITSVMTGGQALTATSEREERYIDALMNRYDTNGDGVIETTEAGAGRTLERFDANGDGQVTRAEMRGIFRRITTPERAVRGGTRRER